MSVALTAIRFTGIPTLAGIGALNLRKNALEMVPVPEWQAGFAAPHFSKAAYATHGTWGRPVAIQAQFIRTLPSVARLEVRAIPPSPLRAFQPWLEGLLPAADPATARALDRLLATQDHLLGATTPRWIGFQPNGESGFETFELPDHRLWTAGVGIHAVEWRWQFREFPGAAWRDFARTQHRIYTVLETPRLPWTQFPFAWENTQLPWTDVLDYACLWAAGAMTPDSASTAITQAVYNLGPAIIQYGCPIFALSQYGLLFFDCTAFLERLAGGWGNGPYVNCTDCATIVSTFANALGCDLWQSRMGPIVGIQFDTHPIRAIGDLSWSTPCRVFTGFQYHEVAWKDACSFADALFDACLLVNGNFNPALPPMIALLPANLPFVGRFGGGYRERLVTALGQSNCVPQPLLRQRRPVA